MDADDRRDRVKAAWSYGIFAAVLNKSGYVTNTAGAEEAARLLAELGWSESTWTTRASQFARWLRFCDGDLRSPRPSDEGDVLSYIGFLSLEGRLCADSLPQYISAVSRYHELHGFPSPTHTNVDSSLMVPIEGSLMNVLHL